MNKFEITEEEYVDEMASRAGLEKLLLRVYADVRIAFWEESSRVIAWMAWESIPFLKAIDTFLVSKPELNNADFVAIAFMIKGRVPNMPLMEILKVAEVAYNKQKEKKSDGKAGEAG